MNLVNKWKYSSKWGIYERLIWPFLFDAYLHTENRYLKNFKCIRWCENIVKLCEYNHYCKAFTCNILSSIFTSEKVSMISTLKLCIVR